MFSRIVILAFATLILGSIRGKCQTQNADAIKAWTRLTSGPQTIAEIESQAKRSAIIWTATAGNYEAYFGGEATPILREFGDRFDSWWSGYSQSKRKQGINQLIQTKFEVVANHAGRKLDDALQGALQSGKTNIVMNAVQLETVLTERKFLAVAGPFLIDELQHSAAGTKPSALFERALARAVTFQALGSHIAQLRVPVLKEAQLRTLSELQSRFANLAGITPFHANETKTAGITDFNENYVQAVISLADDLKTSLLGIENVLTKLPGTASFNKTAKVGASNILAAIVPDKPIAPPRPTDAMSLVVTSNGSDQGFKVEFVLDRTAIIEGTNWISRRLPLGYSVVGVQVENGTFRLRSSGKLLNAAFDETRLRKTFDNFGIPQWMFSLEADPAARFTVATDEDLKALTIQGLLRVPSLALWDIKIPERSCPFEITLKTGSPAFETVKAALNKCVIQLRKDVSEAVREAVRRETAGLPLKIAMVEDESAGSKLAFDIEIGVPGAPGDAVNRAISFRLTFDDIAAFHNPSISRFRQDSGLSHWLADHVLQTLPELPNNPVAQAIRITELIPTSRENALGFKGVIAFEIPQRKYEIPSIPFTLYFSGGALRFDPDLSAVNIWKSWAQKELAKVTKELEGELNGEINKALEGIKNAGAFQLIPGSPIWARINGEPIYHPDAKNYEVAVDLKLSPEGSPPDWSKNVLRLKRVIIRQVEIKNGKVTFPNIKFEKAEISGDIDLRQWLTPILSLPENKIQILDPKLVNGHLVFALTMDLPEVGLAIQTGSIELQLANPKLDLRKLMTDSIIAALNKRIAENFSGLPQTGPIKNITVEVKSDQNPFALWIKGSAPLYGGIELPLAVRVFPSFDFPVPDTTKIINLVQGKLLAELNLNIGGVSIKPAAQFFRTSPLRLNFNVNVNVLGFGAELEGLAITAKSIELPEEFTFGLPGVSAAITPTISAASGGTMAVANISLTVSLRQAGTIGINGDFTPLSEALAEIIRLRGSLRASLGNINTMKFSYTGDLLLFRAIPLFAMKGELDFGRALVTSSAGTAGPLKSLLDVQDESRLDFRNLEYSQRASVGAFGIHLADSEMDIQFKNLLLSTHAMANLEVFGSVDGGLTVALKDPDQSRIVLDVHSPICSFVVSNPKLDVNLQRARLTVRVFGIKCGLEEPMITGFTPELIEDYIASLFHLQIPDLKSLLKNGLVITPRSGPGGEGTQAADGNGQSDGGKGENSGGPAKPGTNQKPTNPGEKGSTPPVQITSDGPSGGQVSGGSGVHVSPGSQPVFLSAGLARFVNGKSCSFLPRQIDSSGVYNNWTFDNGEIVCVLKSGNDELRIARLSGEKATADNDQREPEVLGVKFSELFQSTDSQRPKSTLPINQVVVQRALDDIIDYNEWPRTKFLFNRCAAAESTARVIMWREKEPAHRNRHFAWLFFGERGKDVQWYDGGPNATILFSESVSGDPQRRSLGSNDLVVVKEFVDPTLPQLKPEAWRYASAIAQTGNPGAIRAATTEGFIVTRGFRVAVVTPIDDLKINDFQIDPVRFNAEVEPTICKAMLDATISWTAQYRDQRLELRAAQIGNRNSQVVALARLGKTIEQFQGILCRSGGSARWSGSDLKDRKKKLEEQYRDEKHPGVLWNIPLDLSNEEAQINFIHLLAAPDSEWLGKWPVTPWKLLD